MRRLYFFVAVMLFSLPVLADPDYASIDTFTEVPTNGAAVTTNATAYPLTGWADTIILSLSGYASPTVDVDVATSGSEGTGDARTLFSIDNVAADASYPIADLRCTTAGADVTGATTLIPLVQDTVKVWVSNANSTGITAKVYFIIRHQP